LVTQELPSLPHSLHSLKTKQALVELCAEKGFRVSEGQLKRSVQETVEAFLSADSFWGTNNPETLPGSHAFATLTLAGELRTTADIADRTTTCVKELAASISARAATKADIQRQIQGMHTPRSVQKAPKITREFVVKWFGSDTGYHCFLSCGGDEAALMVELQVTVLLCLLCCCT
jgi:hypothetical protein